MTGCGAETPSQWLWLLRGKSIDGLKRWISSSAVGKDWARQSNRPATLPRKPSPCHGPIDRDVKWAGLA